MIYSFPKGGNFRKGFYLFLCSFTHRNDEIFIRTEGQFAMSIERNELYVDGGVGIRTVIDKTEKISVRKKLYYALKRSFDICGSLIGIVILSIPMLIVALIIFLQDGGSPIYKHMRIGKDGKEFGLYKFRSMEKEAAALEDILTPEQLEQYQKEFKIDDDPRITPFGNFIRKTSIDELPQMFNILSGDMSVIGPRPIVEDEVKFYGNKKNEFLSVKPGLTGYWQAYARNNAGYEDGQRQKMELYYVHNQSLWLDVKIFFKTIVSVFKESGAQ